MNTGLSGKRIFVVEDDVVNMAIFAVMLKHAGAFVIQDPWNNQTIELIKHNLPIDIILLDLMLRQRVSGYDIYDQLQADQELSRIPVLAVSASDPEFEIPRAKEKGFIGFIRKPINQIQFPDHVASCIAGRQVWLTG